MRIQENFKFLTLTAGVLTALILIFSQLFYFQAATFCQKKVETEQHNQKSGHEQYISIPSTSISASPSVELNEGLSFVIQVFSAEAQGESQVSQVSVPVGKLFQTLFRFFIAPNAP